MATLADSHSMLRKHGSMKHSLHVVVPFPNRQDSNSSKTVDPVLQCVKHQLKRAAGTYPLLDKIKEAKQIYQKENFHRRAIAKAATKIQAVFRGHKVRTTMKKSDTTTITNPTTNKAVPAPNNIKHGDTMEAELTKADLEAEFDPNDKELCDAALKIQTAFRGHMTRKIVNKDAPEDIDIQEITKKVAEELDIDLTDPELNKAASKIQASFRGHKTRKDAATTAQ